MTGLHPGRPDQGFHEAVLVVADAESVASTYADAFGFARLHAGRVTEALAAFYGGALRAGGADLVVGPADQDRGFLRLLEAADGRPVARPGGQAWDTGGIFDIDLRALGDIERLTERAMARGFSPLAPITDYDFAGLQVREVVMLGPEAVGVALIAQVAPPLQGFEGASGPASFAFNSTQVVTSLDRARAFFVDALGWKPVYETAWAHPGSGHNCLGLPLNIARTQPLKVGIYQAQGENLGSVELLEIEGVEGRDFRAPPGEVRRGLAALRFPVADLDGAVSAAIGGGGAMIRAPAPLELAPYGACRAAAVETPWGARLEFYAR